MHEKLYWDTQIGIFLSFSLIIFSSIFDMQYKNNLTLLPAILTSLGSTDLHPITCDRKIQYVMTDLETLSDGPPEGSGTGVIKFSLTLSLNSLSLPMVDKRRCLRNCLHSMVDHLPTGVSIFQEMMLSTGTTEISL